MVIKVNGNFIFHANLKKDLLKIIKFWKFDGRIILKTFPNSHDSPIFGLVMIKR
jgi:hypothetical protein